MCWGEVDAGEELHHFERAPFGKTKLLTVEDVRPEGWSVFTGIPMRDSQHIQEEGAVGEQVRRR